MPTSPFNPGAFTESYDAVKLVVSPSTLNETYQAVTSLVEDVVNKLEDINNTLNNNVMTELATAACNRLIHDIPARTPVETEMREACLP